MKKIIITIPSKCLWNWHTACELEILEGCPVDEFRIIAVLPHWSDQAYDSVFYNNPSSRIAKRQQWYFEKYQKAYGLLSHPVEIVAEPAIQFEKRFEDWLRDLRGRVKSLFELVEEEFDGFEVGAGAVSSFVSGHRKLVVNLEQHWELLEELLRCSYGSYLTAKSAIARFSPDTILAFNGRYASSRGVLPAAREAGIECWLHERASAKERYEVFENALPHNQVNFHKRMNSWLAIQQPDEVEEAGKAFFERRRAGEEQGWKSFVGKQREGQLPEGMDRRQENVVIFNSSEDEFVSIGKEWANPIYASQVEGVKAILQDSIKRSHQMYWIRMHPNLGKLAKEEVAAWYELEQEFANVRVIEPLSSVGSYSLLEVADKVLTFGSTVGVEATYWKRPSILAGTCFYRGLGACHECSSHEEVLSALSNSDLEVKGERESLEYGAFQNSFGTEFKYVQVPALEVALFKGRSTRGRALSSLSAWGIKKLWRSAIKPDYWRVWRNGLKKAISRGRVCS